MALQAIFSRLPARMTGWEVFLFFGENDVYVFLPLTSYNHH